MTWKVSADPVDFDEAIAWFRTRLPITKGELRKLRGDAATRAFYVSNVAQLDVVRHVWKALDKAVSAGTTLEDFKKEIGPALKKAWSGQVKDPAWRTETIFRTNLQNAYSAGRFRQATTPEVIEDRPVWMFDAILDGRETPICQACDGTKRPSDDDWWKTHLPPLHFNCRSSFIALSREQAGRITPQPPPVSADSGFGEVPVTDASDLGRRSRERIADAPGPLREVARAKMAGGPPGLVGQPAVAAAQKHEFAPSGTPISEALTLGGGRVKKQLAETIEVVDELHGDGKLDKLLVRQVGGKDQHGAFLHDPKSKETKIVINSGARYPRLSLLHEIGHLLDNQVLGTRWFNASEFGDIEGVMKAIRSTFAYREMVALTEREHVLIPRPDGHRERFPLDQKWLKYLLKPQELFARAYARYMATRSGKQAFLDELNRQHADRHVLLYRESWDDDDFVRVAKAMDELFAKRGWMTSKAK